MRTIDELIGEAETFAGLAQEHLELIAGCARNEHITSGTLLLRQGEPADRFYLIRHGVLALEVDAPGRGPLLIQTLQEGEVAGWSWLFAPYRWSMDGRAVTDCSVVGFDGACLRGKCEGDHELGYQLMQRFAANLVDRLQETRLQLLDVYGQTPATA
ncbi:MAG: cyclic nucleotide-binding domain-containing protein [Solirubrobacteraceae bacterium]|jgi:CRP-like cAMP-binding protein